MSQPYMYYEIKGKAYSLETVSSITPATAWLAQLRPFGNVRCSCVAFSVPGHNAALALHTLPRKSVFETPMGHQ